MTPQCAPFPAGCVHRVPPRGAVRRARAPPHLHPDALGNLALGRIPARQAGQELWWRCRASTDAGEAGVGWSGARGVLVAGLRVSLAGREAGTHCAGKPRAHGAMAPRHCPPSPAAGDCDASHPAPVLARLHRDGRARSRDDRVVPAGARQPHLRRNNNSPLAEPPVTWPIRRRSSRLCCGARTRLAHTRTPSPAPRCTTWRLTPTMPTTTRWATRRRRRRPCRRRRRTTTTTRTTTTSRGRSGGRP